MNSMEALLKKSHQKKCEIIVKLRDGRELAGIVINWFGKLKPVKIGLFTRQQKDGQTESSEEFFTLYDVTNVQLVA